MKPTLLLFLIVGLLFLAPVMAAEDLKASLTAHLSTVEQDLEGKKIPGVAAERRFGRGKNKV